MPSYSGPYEVEYDYERENDVKYYNCGYEDGQFKVVCGYKYGYGIDNNTFYLARNGVCYDEWIREKNVSIGYGGIIDGLISKSMSIYIPDIGITPKYFEKYTHEEINNYFVDYLSRVLCWYPHHMIVKKIHKVHSKLDKDTDTISCKVYVEWYDNTKTWLLQKDIRNKKQRVSIKFEDGFEWRLLMNYRPVGDFEYEEKLRSEIDWLRTMGKTQLY